MGRPVDFGLAPGAAELDGSRGSVVVDAGRRGSDGRAVVLEEGGAAAFGGAVDEAPLGSAGKGMSIGASSFERHPDASATARTRSDVPREITSAGYADPRDLHQ